MPFRHLVLIPLLAIALGAQAREQSGSHADGGSRSDSSARSEPSSRPDSASRTSVQPQDTSSRGRAVSDADAVQADVLDRQKRRDVLREALRSQPEATPAAARQMSLQERSELRQQLRQQQDWYK